jgi:hypothetical protein
MQASNQLLYRLPAAGGENFEVLQVSGSKLAKPGRVKLHAASQGARCGALLRSGFRGSARPGAQAFGRLAGCLLFVLLWAGHCSPHIAVGSSLRRRPLHKPFLPMLWFDALFRITSVGRSCSAVSTRVVLGNGWQPEFPQVRDEGQPDLESAAQAAKRGDVLCATSNRWRLPLGTLEPRVGGRARHCPLLGGCGRGMHSLRPCMRDRPIWFLHIV